MTKVVTAHNHPAAASRDEVLNALEHAKVEASSTTRITADVVNRANTLVTLHNRAQMPSDVSLKRMVQRRRNDALGAPANVDHRRQLVLPPRYQEYEIEQGRSEQNTAELNTKCTYVNWDTVNPPISPPTRIRLDKTRYATSPDE